MVETDLMIYCIIAFFLGYYLNNICSRPNYEYFSFGKTDKCSINEEKNRKGPHRCTSDSHCQGDRYCGSKNMRGERWCTGDARCGDCSINEANNSGGSNRCTSDSECAGDRYCLGVRLGGGLGYCKGESNC